MRMFRSSFHHQSSSSSSSSVVDDEKQPQQQEETFLDPEDDILTSVRKEEWYYQPLVVLVVGASGDLAKKKTYPALYELWKAQLLPQQKHNTTITIRGFARTKMTDAQFRAHLRTPLLAVKAAETSGEGVVGSNEAASVDEFLELCFYDSGTDYGDWESLFGVLQRSSAARNSPLHNLLVYLAVPPHVFGDATLAVKLALGTLEPKVPGFTRIILEKPFGRDTESCNELLQTLKDQGWEERDLYRIDHYLGKEMVQNILILREHNPWLNAIWNKDTVCSVHIIFKEPFGTDGRGGYFDSYGIVRDVLQNHLLQVLTLVAMDIPEKMTNDSIRDAKAKVLSQMPEIVLDDSLAGQYIGYKDDPTIENRDTITPTYACMRCWVNSETWTGVPFILEAGKAMDERTCEVRLNLRGNRKNVLVLRLQPIPALFFTANLKTPGFSKNPVSTHIGVDYGQTEVPDAYTRLLLDVCRGQQASFVRDDELLQAWKIFTPVLNQMERDLHEPILYKEGSPGPAVRKEFLRAMGVTQAWLPPASRL